MNFEICKKCQNFPVSDTLFGYICSYDDMRNTVEFHFCIGGHRRENTKVLIECDENTMEKIYDTDMRPDVVKTLLNGYKVLNCSETDENNSFYVSHICPYQIEHFISDCSK